MDLSEALAAVQSSSQKAQQAASDYSNTANQNMQEADIILQNAKTQQQNLLDATNALGVLKQKEAQAVVQKETTDSAINAWQKGNAALAPDISGAVDRVTDEAKHYAATQGGFLNQLVLGLTGRDIALEQVQKKVQGVQTLTGLVDDLATKARASDLTTKQLQATAMAPEEVAVQNKIDQATAYLEHVVPAEDRTLAIKGRAASEQASAAELQSGEAKNLFSALIQYRSAMKQDSVAEAQKQLLNLNVAEKLREVQNAQESDEYLTSLSNQLSIPKPALKAQGPEVIMGLSSIAAGIPIVSNIADPKQVELATKVSSALPDPYQKVTAPYVGSELLAFQQDQNSVQQQLLTGKKLDQVVKNANYSLVRDVKNDFLDKVPITLPGEAQKAPLTDILGNWFTNPVGSKGGVFWNSGSVKSYIASNQAGSEVAKRIFSDMKNNPGALKGGITINYLTQIGATPAQAYDMYRFIQHQVIMSTPYSIYGLAPPQANFGLTTETVQTGLFGDVVPQASKVIPNNEADIERAMVQYKAAQKAIKFSQENAAAMALLPTGAGN